MMRVATFLVLISITTSAQAASDPDFVQRVLAAHNSERAAVGVQPLVWSDALAADAAPWAAHLAKTGRFEHSPSDQRMNEGENIWEGTAGGSTIEQMIGAWAGEAQLPTRRFQKWHQRWADDRHQTQMIWKNTTQVGCAMASGGGNDVLVCRYAPPGNLIGEMPY